LLIIPLYYLPFGGLGVSATAGLRSGQFNQIKNLTKYNFIFLTGSTGWTG
jgi:hypothetical protein